jgi:rare lipoprotein A
MTRSSCIPAGFLFAGSLVTAAVFIGCSGSSPRFTFAGDKSASSSGPASTGTAAAVPVGTAEEGVASYYADEFNGRKTSNGETYDMHKYTAAHRTLPFNTMVRVTNLETGKTLVVRINDRGPFKDDRIIDLSLAAAKELELIATGTGRVRLEVVAPDDTTIQR